MDRAPARTGSACLLERARELERIDRLLADAVGRAGRAMLIEGPAGIGKTALLEAARQRAGTLGVTVLAARGGELEAHFPFGVVRQLFEPLLHRSSARARAQLLAGAAHLAGPVVGARLEAAPPGSDLSGPLHGLYWLTVNLASRAPVLIVVDDAHWADERSLRYLLYLVGRLDGVPAAVLVALRPTERGLEPSLATRLIGDRTLEVIALAGLSERAVGELLAEGLRPSDEAFVAACSEATGGVPFLVHELITALAADNVEPTARRAADVRELGPRSVARATVVRLARTPAGCVALARAVAVLGGDATLPRAAQLTGLQESVALRALDALVAAEVLQVGGRLGFVHPILRAAIYDEIAPGERSTLHRESARLLAAEGAELDAIAAQLLATEPAGSAAVIAQLRDAAALALTRGAPEGAIAYLSRALAEGCERELRAAISFELGTAARLAGRQAMVEHFRRAHRLATDPVLRNRAALELATALGLRGERETPMALVQSALADLGDRDRGLAVRLECLRAAFTASAPRLVDEFDRRVPALRDLVRQGGEAPRTLALLLAAAASWRGEDAHSVVALVDQGWDDGRLMAEGGDLWVVGQALAALVMCEQLRQAGGLTDALLQDARARGSAPRFALASAYRGLIEARCGRLSAAEGALRAAIERARGEHAHFALSLYLWFATDVILERPDAADLATLAQAADPGPMAGTHSGALELDVRGRARYAAGRTAEGIEDLRRAGEVFDALGYHNPTACNWRSALALMLGIERRDEARRLAAAELDDARRLGQARGIGVALRALGVLEGGASGRERLEMAVHVLQASPAVLEYGRALVELGASMRRAGERAAAREPLRQGLDLAVKAGATRLGERARAELEATGAHPRRDRITGSDALTPSELRVARLAAEGATNNEVAQALFVTPKTVDTHLSHAYAKLGISSRRALAAALESEANNE